MSDEFEELTDYSKISEYTRHGGAYDRGSADSYYGRQWNPHYFRGATYSSLQIEHKDMGDDEILAYDQGFSDNESSMNHKDWGYDPDE